MSAPPAPAPGTERHATLAEDFQALANEARLDLLAALTHPLYSEEIAEILGTSRQNAVKHMERLLDRGFVRALEGNRPTGPVVEYQVVPGQLFALARHLEGFAGLQPTGGPESRPAEHTQQGPAGPQEFEPVPQHHPRFLVLDGPDTGQVHPLFPEAGSASLGRHPGNDIVLEHDPFISGRHAEVRGGPSGHLVLDLASSNGTSLNFRRLPAHDPAPLSPGDILSLGHTRLVYQPGREP